jgi:hypothetical protein
MMMLNQTIKPTALEALNYIGSISLIGSEAAP